MKQWKVLALLFLVVAFGLFFTMRPVREKACPLTKKNIAKDPDFVSRCAQEGGVVNSAGACTCPE
jgi:hypothetical protein